MLPLCASHRLVCRFVLASAISSHAKRQWLYPQTGIHDANAKTLDRPSKPVAHGNTRFGLPFWASRPMAIGRSKARCHYPAWSACGWTADGWRMTVGTGAAFTRPHWAQTTAHLATKLVNSQRHELGTPSSARCQPALFFISTCITSPAILGLVAPTHFPKHNLCLVAR